MGRFAERLPIVCECGDHAFVATTRGVTTMVSPQDAHLLETKVTAQLHRGRFRVRGRFVIAGVARVVNLGRAVLGIGDDLLPDHRNSDPLDNRRSNLRPATNVQNHRNRRPKLRDLPKGVHRNGSGFQAEITVDCKRIKLGYFSTPEAAHDAYARAAELYHGEFARTA